MEASSLQTDALMKQYVHVVNYAIGQHRDEFTYPQILGAAERASVDLQAGAAVYKSDPDKPHDRFVLAWKDGKLELIDRGKQGDRRWWSFPRGHIEEGVEDPQPYLDDPMKLDLDWLTRRLGMGSAGEFAQA